MNWKKMLVFGIAGLFSLGLTACSTSPSTTSSAKKNVTNNQTSLEKYRTVITTDGEVDDMNSMIRYLYYSNEMDLAGIILTSSTFHYNSKFYYSKGYKIW